MKYLTIFLLLLVTIQPISYAKYNWDRKNRIGAVGSLLLAVMSFIIPSALLLAR